MMVAMMTVRRCIPALLLVASLLVTGLALAGCGKPMIPPGDEVTTRMNAEDERALDDASPPGRDAGVAPDASQARQPPPRR